MKEYVKLTPDFPLNVLFLDKSTEHKCKIGVRSMTISKMRSNVVCGFKRRVYSYYSGQIDKKI